MVVYGCNCKNVLVIVLCMWLNRVDVWIYKGLRGVYVVIVIVWNVMGYYGMLLYLYIYLYIFGVGM